MIIGLTDRGAQLPRLGILRKGGPKRTIVKNGREIEIAGEDLKDFFRFECDDDAAARDFARAYGDKPNGIRVMFYYATVEANFETWQEHHSAGALKHRCDGQTCVLWLDKDGRYQHDPIPCPSIELKRRDPQVDKKHLCRPVGRLKIVIPELQRMAYVLVPTTSINDILELQSNLEAAQALRGDLRGIPFILSRRPRKVSTPGENGQRARREKWLLSIEPAPDWVKLQLVAMERAALPMAETRLLTAPAVDEATGEIFEEDEPEAEPEREDGRDAPEPTPPLLTPSQAEARFFARYAISIGGHEWADVQRYLMHRAPKPTSVEGWIATAEAVRDKARQQAAEQPNDELYDEVEAAEAAT